MPATIPNENETVFTSTEIAYLQSQRLGRLATVDSTGQPHVVPVAFRYNPILGTIDIGGHDFAKRKKYRDVRRNSKVAFVVDDLVSVNPWQARGLEVRGDAEVLEIGGADIVPGFDPEMFRIRPKRIVSWGLEANQYAPSGRSIK